MVHSPRTFLVATLAAATLAACGSDSNGCSGASCPVPPAANGKITGPIAASRTLTKDTVYTLSGYVKVQAGATLTIQAGTKIIGDTTVAGSSLWILRGAKLVAEGTAAEPIVFTSARSAGNRKPGDWGGIIMIGNGIINRTGATILTEGGAAGQAENYAGGNNNADNSGSLKYVRIEFAGYDISGAGGQELNSLSMYAVGSGTRLEYVESLAGLDDSFEWWGGAVDGRYLVSYEAGDDHFDWTEGFKGRNQFLIGLQSTRLVPTPGTGTQSTDPRGFEGDGCDPVAGSGCILGTTEAATSAPFSMPVFANFTLIGPGALAGFPADGNGAVIRRGTGGTFNNGVIGRWPGIALNGRDAWTDSLRLRDSLSITNVVLVENGSSYDAGSNFFQEAKFAASGHRVAAGGVTAAAQFTSLATAGLDWKPAAASLIATGGGAVVPAKLAGRVVGYPYTGGWTNTAYVGAADPAAGTGWWAGWTTWASN